MGHRHICCDGCQITIFQGSRFRCLRCVNYNLCDICYDHQIETEEHRANHPMQLFPDSDDLVPLLYGEAPELVHLSNCFTCPHCGLLALTAKRFIEHVYVQHRVSNEYVVCPMCAGLSAVELVAIRHLSKHLLHNHIDHANYLEPDTPPLRRIFTRNHMRQHRQSQLQTTRNSRIFDISHWLSTGRVSSDHQLLGNNDPPEEAVNSEYLELGLSAGEPFEQYDDRYFLLQWIAQQKVQCQDTDEFQRLRRTLFAEHLLISMLCCEDLHLPDGDRRIREGNGESDLDQENHNSLSTVMSVMSLPWIGVWQANQLDGPEGEGEIQGAKKDGVDLNKVKIEEHKRVAAEEAID
ncbi:uncharacterized protein LOC6611299 [Drosophila sechellia]|uniref:RING-type E3 ubiquitin transferase n=1 Tax=Drosophila sechellia TaxID=7238 RepID=B4HXI9_DROSE|nr:uncharacterized protein LOC6611299 [Drosophila sechellia]EDW51769.1 GM15732 [Drosophila sechellia]